MTNFVKQQKHFGIKIKILKSSGDERELFVLQEENSRNPYLPDDLKFKYQITDESEITFTINSLQRKLVDIGDTIIEINKQDISDNPFVIKDIKPSGTIRGKIMSYILELSNTVSISGDDF